MTCIAAIKHNGRVTMGGDSAGVGGGQIVTRLDPKVFQCGPFIIGYTSSFRMAQLIRFGLHDAKQITDLEPPSGDDDAFKFMVTDFIPRARYLFDRGGFMEQHQGAEYGGTFFVAWASHLFEVESDLQVGVVADDYAAIGSGAEYALGSMYSTAHLPPADRITNGLNAAVHHCTTVRGPYTIESTTERAE